MSRMVVRILYTLRRLKTRDTNYNLSVRTDTDFRPFFSALSRRISACMCLDDCQSDHVRVKQRVARKCAEIDTRNFPANAAACTRRYQTHRFLRIGSSLTLLFFIRLSPFRIIHEDLVIIIIITGSTSSLLI